MGGSRSPLNILERAVFEAVPRGKGWEINWIVSQASRLRLYHLFGYEAKTQEAGRVNVEGGVDEEREVLSEHAATRGPLVD